MPAQQYLQSFVSCNFPVNFWNLLQGYLENYEQFAVWFVCLTTAVRRSSACDAEPVGAECVNIVSTVKYTVT